MTGQLAKFCLAVSGSETDECGLCMQVRCRALLGLVSGADEVPSNRNSLMQDCPRASRGSAFGTLIHDRLCLYGRRCGTFNTPGSLLGSH